MIALRVCYRRRLLHLAARDLTGAVTIDETAAELADLAAAALEGALAIASSRLVPQAQACRIAVIAMGRVMMYPDQTFLFALTVGITVLFIILAGCTVGSMLPLLLKRLGIDPATSSTPFIASLVDTMGVVIYAHVASVVMHDVIAAAQAHGAPP